MNNEMVTININVYKENVEWQKLTETLPVKTAETLPVKTAEKVHAGKYCSYFPLRLISEEKLTHTPALLMMLILTEAKFRKRFDNLSIDFHALKLPRQSLVRAKKFLIDNNWVYIAKGGKIVALNENCHFNREELDMIRGNILIVMHDEEKQEI